MIGLARIADRGPFVAAALAAALLLAALWLPALVAAGNMSGMLILASMASMFFLIASAAVVAFVALRHGELSAIQVVGGCLVMLIVVSIVLYQSPIHVPLVASVFWLPAILAGMVLARSVKLDYAVLTIVACGVVVVIGLSLITGDSTEFWRSQFGSAVVMEEDAAALSVEQQEAFMTTMARMMTGALGVSVVSIALGALFLARSWQAGLFNPGGFQKEFHALSLGRNAAFACVLIVALAIMMGGQLAGAIAMVVIFAFFVQGLAVTHALVKQRGMHRYWLHGIYVLLLLPHTLLLLAALGLADNLFSLRRSKNV
ncbi:hypothetical protein ACUNV4_11230 [Granulosicoccus sp. 3-233]|uniref:hypothetical protein n=1 Tax=Granulosicoccus sp. 3-233 TaxID=3417969 RepID=UPI003D3407B5